MSLVFSAICPHPPVLIPGIGKKEVEKIEQTNKALKKLEQDLYIAKPQILIVISPHGSLFKDAFSVNAHPEFHSHFDQFGDLSTKKTWAGARSTRCRKVPGRAVDWHLPR